MGTVTPIAIPGEGYVRVEVNWQDIPHTRKCWIFRRIAGQTAQVRLRDGNAVPLSNGIAVAFDHEAPLDTALTYRSAVSLNANGDFEDGVSEWTDTTNSGTVGTVTQSRDYYVSGEGLASAKLTPSGAATSKAVSEMIPLTPSSRNANPFFEVNAANWTGQNGAAISRDTATPHEGVASLLITPDGVTSIPQVVSEEMAVVAGSSYTYSAWLRLSTAATGSRLFGIRWFDAAHATLSESSTTLSPAVTVWTQFTAVVTAPAGAAFARLITNAPGGVLAATNTWRIDEAILWDATQARRYTIQGRLMVPDYYNGGIGVKIQWYNGTTLLGTNGAFNDLSPFPGNWGAYGFTSADMATANAARIVFGLDGSAPSTLPLYGDEIYLTTTLTAVNATTDVTVPSNGAGWWTDPLHPATKIRLQVDLYVSQRGDLPAGVAYLGVAEETFAADSSTFDVNDAPDPIGFWNRRKSGQQSIRIGTSTDADIASVRALHASGAPLFLQLAAAYREADAYGLHGDLTVGRIHGEQQVPWRIAVSTFAKVAPPPGPAEGTLRTRYMDLTAYATYAAATSAGATWLDALRGSLAS